VLRRGFATEVKRSAAKAVINTSVVLNRAPFLTRTPTPFELAYFSYQQRIRRALSNPFPHEFYFKPGSLLETRFNMEERKREKRAFGPGFLPEETVSEEERLANEAAVEQLAQQEGEGEELAPRVHAADASVDVKSLDRLGQRNLYLLVQTPEKQWVFPQGQATGNDLALHQVCFLSSVLPNTCSCSTVCPKSTVRASRGQDGLLDCRPVAHWCLSTRRGFRLRGKCSESVFGPETDFMSRTIPFSSRVTSLPGRQTSTARPSQTLHGSPSKKSSLG